MTLGLLTNAMQGKLRKVVYDDRKDRKEHHGSAVVLDSTLLNQLSSRITKGKGSQEEPLPESDRLCILRRFLTLEFKMSLEDIDEALRTAQLLPVTDPINQGVLV